MRPWKHVYIIVNKKGEGLNFTISGNTPATWRRLSKDLESIFNKRLKVSEMKMLGYYCRRARISWDEMTERDVIRSYSRLRERQPRPDTPLCQGSTSSEANTQQPPPPHSRSEDCP